MRLANHRLTITSTLIAITACWPTSSGGGDHVLTGRIVTSSTCQALSLDHPDPALPTVPLSERIRVAANVTVLRLCPLPIPDDVVWTDLPASAPQFTALLAALSRPSDIGPPGQICERHANVEPTVIATLRDGVHFEVAFPTDGCRHFRRDLLESLTAVPLRHQPDARRRPQPSRTSA
jgi:hypothetical protein